MRILLVRPDALGDVVLMIPLLNTLKQNYPDAEIYTLQQPYTIPLLQRHESITAVIPDWNRMDKAGGVWGFFAYAQYLKSFRFDMIFFPYLEPYYVFLAMAAGIPIRVGDSNKLGLRLFLSHSVPLNFRNLLLHESEHSAQLIRAVKPEAMVSSAMDLVVTDEDTQAAQDLFEESGGDGLRPYIIIHPRSGGGNRPWLPAKYAALIDYLVPHSDYQVVLTGAGPMEIQTIADIRFLTQNPVIDLSGKTPLRTLMGLIKNASVVIGTDTGPTHIAAALRVPVVSISPTKFVKALRWGPWETLNSVIGESHACQLICHPYRCKKTICLDAIDVSRVGNEIIKLGAAEKSLSSNLSTKHQWIKVSMPMMVYWAGKESDIDLVIYQYQMLKRYGFVTYVGVRSWRFRRQLVAALGIPSTDVLVIPPFDWFGMVRGVITRDIVVVFVVGPMVSWYWYLIRQICALWQYAPPTAIPASYQVVSPDDVILAITEAMYQ